MRFLTARKRGSILIGVLFLILVLRMMTIALLVRLHGTSYANRGSVDDQQALLACEGGIAESLAQLGQGKSWNGTGNAPRLSPDGNSSYQVSFPPSLNNLNGTTANISDGPNGPVTVPPFTAYIVSVGHSGTRTLTAQSLIGHVLSNQNNATAIQGGGSITVLGKADISGQTSANDSTPQKVQVISTFPDDSMGTVVQLSSGTVDGMIKVTDSVNSSVSIGSAAVSGGVQFGVPPQALISLNLPAQIAAHVNATHLNFPSPGTPMNVSPGDYYIDGNLAYTGNLTLDHANLFVKGSLDLIGPLSGSGALVVGNTTSIYGSAQLRGSSQLGVAILSEGSINLHGYNGMQWLTQVAANGGNDLNGVSYATHLNNLISGINQQRLDLSDYLQGTDKTRFGFNESDYDHIGWCIAHVPNYAGGQPFQNSTLAFTSVLNETNPLGKLENLVQGHDPSSPQDLIDRDFVMAKLQSMFTAGNVESGFYGVLSEPQGRDNVLTDALQQGNLNGLSDVLNDADTYNSDTIYMNQNWKNYSPAQIAAGYSLLNVTVQNLSFDNLGSARFNGVLYTHGHIYCSEGIQIIGAALAQDDGSQSGVETVGNHQLHPGDIFLENSTVIRYVPGIENLAAQSLGTLGVISWSLR